MKKLYAILLIFILCNTVYGQIPLPQNLPQTHPRLLTTSDYKSVLQKQIKDEDWAGEVLQGIIGRIDKYVNRHITDSTWMPSRLMMYWKTNATQVYIKGGVYSHADGKAPVPTVRFGSTRGIASPYKRPKLEDIIPYMDGGVAGDEVFFVNTSKEGNPLEWVKQSNVSGSSIESINEEIMKYAKDASFVYWLTGDEKYAKFAFDVFDTYLTGMYYRKEPIDLNNGHAQTLVGMSTFEVIQERILNELAYTYDFLHGYIEANRPEKMMIYETALKNWIDISIKNGVPQNNWNLHKSKFILKVGMVLEDNKHYADGKGREYYIDYILNKTSARQWSLSKFMDYGYDSDNGIWNECPGYAQGVTRDLTNFLRDYDNTFNQNILPYTPVMHKAVSVLPQYLFPNNVITAFGDTYYVGINTEAMSDMICMAQKYNDRDSEVHFTEMYRLFGTDGELVDKAMQKLPSQITSFFTSKPLEIDPAITKGKLTDYITPTFYAPNVSWLVQRNKYSNKQNGLMISQYASFGNHMHANGVAIELYGKGFVLGAESGRGSSYFQPDYLEYYSQFPAHNTVMVDGISKYPEMLSNHSFDLLTMYPASGQKNGYYPHITFSNVYFLEPESRSDQNRFLSIVSTGETTGYYIDIFRSKKQRSGEKYHDYFYHNLGTEFEITDTKGKKLDLALSEEIGFAGGHLFALDYMWDKKSIKTDDDYRAIWKMKMPDNNHIYMNLWMKGSERREVFSIKSPPTKAFRGNHGIPYDVEESPYLTFAARQYGEAWNHPFVSVFEPTTDIEGQSIESIVSFEVSGASPDFVGLIISNKSGRKDYIFSSVADEKVSFNNMVVNGTYAVISEDKSGFTLFLGNGKFIQSKGFTIKSEENTTAVLEYKNGEYSLACDKPVIIKTPKGKTIKQGETSWRKINL